MSDYNKQIDIIAENIKTAIKEMKANGTTACSLENLLQMTKTTGVIIPQQAYRTAFQTAALKAAKSFLT